MSEPKSWNTKDFSEDFRKLATVSDDGIELIFKSLSMNHGQYEFAMHGIEDGESVAYLFSSKKLASLILKVENEIVGKKIGIVPDGVGVEREYDVKLVI